MSIFMRDGAGDAVPGGMFRLYRVGDAISQNSNLRFELTDAFRGSGVSLNDLNADGLKEAFDKGDDIEIVLEPWIVQEIKHSIRVRVVFGSGGRGEVFELRMDQAME